MGIIHNLVERSQRGGAPEVEQSDRIITPANLLSASRPALALKAASMLLHGQKGAGAVVALMAATDMEGYPARKIDKKWPESGLGTSKFGTKADTYADASAMLIVAGAALLAPRVSAPGKAAVGIVLAQEGYKTGWAALRAAQYLQATGELLEIPTDIIGKVAMVKKFVAIEAAVCTGDFDNPYIRQGLGAASLGFALAGASDGESARTSYQELFEFKMEDIPKILPVEPLTWPHPMRRAR